MDFKTQVTGSAGLPGVVAGALLVVVSGPSVPATLESPLADALNAALAEGDFTVKAGSVLLLHKLAGVKAQRVVFVASGDASAKSWRKAVAAGVAAVKGGGAKDLAVALAGTGELVAAHAEALVGAVTDSIYTYRHTKPSAPPPPALASVKLLCSKPQAAALGEGLRQGEAIAEGVALARECANRPGNHCTPSHLADQAERLGKDFGLKVEVLERKDVEKLGMGAFLAVAQGSHEPLKFIVARWNGAGKGHAPVVLVGKGITFDTGGISIKPAGEMDEMKFDMGGAASVLGTLRAVAQLKAKVNLVGIIPACENMPDGKAVKPGDVVTSLSGQTIEILNTDAEGRLILCDALTYAKGLKPAVVVDIATLTGACVVALGHHRTGLFCADDGIAAELLSAGETALDPAWRLPLDEEYDDALKSNFADMGNVGPRAGGAITAAMFLKRYTADYPWAHLDIAGTAWKSGAQKGATGRPVPLLTHFVLSRAG
jgi:leucyl aminopeptidase